MSARPTPAERLLAMLDDPDTVESLGFDEVRADLAVLGIDPGPATAFAKGLAAASESPAARLLGAIDDAEDAEQQIARFESADIEDIRSLAPRGSAAALTGKVRRMAGAESNVVGIGPRRRGRGILKWGGAFGGIAACLLVVMVMTRSYLADQRSMIESSVSRSHSIESRQSAEPGADLLAKSEGVRQARKSSPGAAPAPSVATAPTGGLEPERFADESVAGEAPVAGLLRRSDEAAASPPRAGSGAAITAMLLAEPARTPAQVQSRRLPEGNLATRLEEARRLAGDRPVIALFTVADESGARDYVQVPLLPRMSQQQVAPPPLTRLFGADAAKYDFIPLPSP